MLKKNCRIFGRAIPLWLVLTFAVVLVATAAFFVFLSLGIFTVNLATAPGPVLIGGPEPRGCFIPEGGDPEEYGIVCDLTAIDGEVNHSVAVTGAYAGVFLVIRIPVENLDSVNVVYGQPVDSSGLPAGITFTNSPFSSNEFCGLALAPAATGGYDYLITFDSAYDGSPFEIPFLWTLDDPGVACPTY